MACCRHEREEAEDVLQTSYLKALEGKAIFNGSSSVKTWMFGVVRKTAQERRRYALVRVLWRNSVPVDRNGAAPDPETLASDREAHARLRTMLGHLSSRQRDLLHLVYYQEMTIEEASEVLGISLGSARTHYERGKQRLRALVNGASHP
jgi:RNA polymerase sigma-70 factor (ECF subfamily)